MPRTILDVSRWQGSINWDKVKASGLVSGVMIRAMGNSKEGKPSKPYIDPYFARNYAECTRLGIPVGVYGYFKATTKAQADKELALFKQALGGKTFQLPVAVDIEARRSAQAVRHQKGIRKIPGQAAAPVFFVAHHSFVV